jgi:hypothetical protein
MNRMKSVYEEKDKYPTTMILILGITSVFLLLPAYSGLDVFSRGDFAYITSVGFLFATISIGIFVLRGGLLLLSHIAVKSYLGILFASHIILVLFGIGLILFNVMNSWIHYEVLHSCEYAKREYSGKCVHALMKMLDDTSQPYALRNSAIWALGQLGESEALPTVQKYYTGNIPPREPIQKTISQYELQKSIRLLSGKPNIFAFFWRTKSVFK